MFGNVYALPRSRAKFFVPAVRKISIIEILVGDITTAVWFRTAITYVRRFFQSQALFLHERFAYLVAFDAGRTFRIADDELFTDIDLLAGKPFGTEVVWVIKDLLWIDVAGPVEAYLFGDGGRVFAQEPGDILKRNIFV